MGINDLSLDDINQYYPGRSNILSHLSILMAVAPPPFMHIFDPHTPRTTCRLIASLLDILGSSDDPELKPLRYACVDAREIVSARQFYDRAINAFAGHRPTRTNSYENWASGTWSDSLDSFLAGLREIGKLFAAEKKKSDSDIMDTTETSDQNELDQAISCNLVLVVENANYLSGPLKELLVPLTRLSEMVTNSTTILISDVRWDDIRETSRACPDPYLIKVPALSREDAILYLSSHFPPPLVIKQGAVKAPGLPSLTAAHDDLVPLRQHFLSAAYDICSPHSRDPAEIAYVVQATWPAFVTPILADWNTIRISQIPENDMDVDIDDSGTGDVQGPEELLSQWRRTASTSEYPLPTEGTRLRLIRHFSPSILAAFHELLPRRTSARTWAKSHIPPTSFRASQWTSYPQMNVDVERTEAPNSDLTAYGSSHTRMLILACYLASYNPSKSDMRIFGRDSSGIPKRKNRGYAKGKGKGATAKIPQKLLGPSAFGLERMLAILEALTLEYIDFPGLDEAYEREDTANLETSRARILSELAQLVQEGQIARTGAIDSIACNSTFKCNIGFEEIEQIADSLRVPINELLWDPENQ
ncbi:Origin recognition complex (ORC) subunit 5 C-terminus [Rhizoctonia solani]|uniref:Origin recognition complex (ORC) subunit 5 C-terminus n=1 Tax=Rhizoctonia solani TaxID=456999 RepID=A0A8H7H325_9AGAM|nr:Origin recognition complex (ORC) subunit 5 C-terminus [Rhizoctonia solani]